MSKFGLFSSVLMRDHLVGLSNVEVRVCLYAWRNYYYSYFLQLNVNLQTEGRKV